MLHNDTHDVEVDEAGRIIYVHRRGGIMAATKRKEVKSMDMYTRLKNLDIDRVDIDEKIALSAFAKMLTAEYASYGAEPPEWLDVRVKELNRDIRASQASLIEKRLRELRARKAALLPREKKLENLDADIAALEAKLH